MAWAAAKSRRGPALSSVYRQRENVRDAGMVVATLLPPDVTKGAVTVGGKPPLRGNRDIAYMLARDALSPWRTALGNAELGTEIRGVPAKERRDRARALLETVGLKGLRGHPKALSQACASAWRWRAPSPRQLML
jgi:hypothetical protein